MYVLGKNEKAYLRRIIINTKNDYLKNNKYNGVEEVELEGEAESIVDKKNELDNILVIMNDKDINSCSIENVFEDKEIMKIVKALTLREKLVLFLYYFENNTDIEIGKALSMNSDSVKKVRQRTLIKVKERYLKSGGNKNV